MHLLALTVTGATREVALCNLSKLMEQIKASPDAARWGFADHDAQGGIGRAQYFFNSRLTPPVLAVEAEQTEAA